MGNIIQLKQVWWTNIIENKNQRGVRTYSPNIDRKDLENKMK